VFRLRDEYLPVVKYDDLLLREEVITRTAGALASARRPQQTVLRRPASGLDAELIAELDDGQIFIAQAKHLGCVPREY